jgi:hypothetical protein
LFAVSTLQINLNLNLKKSSSNKKVMSKNVSKFARPVFRPTRISLHQLFSVASALNPFSELLSNLYYSPIKNLENIFIFKIVRQKRP